MHPELAPRPVSRPALSRCAAPGTRSVRSAAGEARAPGTARPVSGADLTAQPPGVCTCVLVSPLCAHLALPPNFGPGLKLYHQCWALPLPKWMSASFPSDGQRSRLPAFAQHEGLGAVVEVTQRDTAVNLPSPGFSWCGWHFPSIQVAGGKKFILIAARPGSHSHTIPGKCGLLGVSCEGESCSKAVCLVVLRVPPDKSVIPKQKISLRCIWLVLPYGQQAVSVNTKT